MTRYCHSARRRVSSLTRNRTGAADRGFSLVELALVLMILAILVAGAIIPLTTTIERTRVDEVAHLLDERVRGALLGFAASRAAGSAFLPCPDCAAACGGGVTNDGIEDRIGSACAVSSGNLPWNTLGVGRADRWGSRLGYAVAPAFADSSGFSLSRPDLSAIGSDISVFDAAGSALIGGAASADGAVAVMWSSGRNQRGAISMQGVVQPVPAAANGAEIENADGDNVFFSRPIVYDPDPDPGSAVEVYDDIVVWISGPELRGFLVQAGRLP